LETESALAKISLTIAPLRPGGWSATPTGFGVDVRRAATDSVDIATSIVTITIRVAGVMLPLAVMFGLPGVGLVLWLRRRQRRLLTVDVGLTRPELEIGANLASFQLACVRDGGRFVAGQGRKFRQVVEQPELLQSLDLRWDPSARGAPSTTLIAMPSAGSRNANKSSASAPPLTTTRPGKC